MSDGLMLGFGLLVYWVLLLTALLIKKHVTIAGHSIISILGVLWLILVPPDMVGFMLNHIGSYFTAIACAALFSFGPICGFYGLLYKNFELPRALMGTPPKPQYSGWLGVVLRILIFGIFCVGGVGPIFALALGHLWLLP